MKITADLEITFQNTGLGSFSFTTLKIHALTEAGRAFLAEKCGRGAVSCEIGLSHGPAWEKMATDAGLVLEIY